MGRKKVARLAGVACVGAVLVLGTQASAIAVPAKPVPAAAPASALAAAGGTTSTDTSSPANAEALFCNFYTNGDYVHISSTAFEASGHGWWTNVDCNTSYADVTVQLQEYYSDGSWRNKGIVGRARVRSGGGAGNRATGRAGCESGAVTGWRSVVDVDLVGLADDPGKLYTPGQNIGCRRTS
jgi:hypothetical protein